MSLLGCSATCRPAPAPPACRRASVSDWTDHVTIDPGITTLDGSVLNYAEMIVARPGIWVLVTGCVNTANGPGLVLRTYGPEGLTKPRFLPLVPGAAAP